MLNESKNVLGAYEKALETFKNLPDIYQEVIKGNAQGVLHCLQDGRDINSIDKEGEKRLIEWAISRGHYHVISLLIEHGMEIADANNRESSLQQIIHDWTDNENDSRSLKLIIEAGTDINALDENRQTPLHRAAANGNFIAVKLLIENGAVVDAKDKDGGTPIFFNIVGKTSREVISLLINNGADANSMDDEESNPLHFLNRVNDLETISLLIENGADAAAANVHGITPLHIACGHKHFWSHLELVALLIKHGADVNARRKCLFNPLHNSITPLHDAALAGCIEIIPLLLKEGANINSIRDDGFTPLTMAIGELRKDVAKLLLENGANPNIVCKQHKQASLHYAVRTDQEDMVSLLLEYGADVNCLAGNGKTPLEFAEFRKKSVSGAKNSSKIIAHLHKRGAT